jgi:glycosyltransferase involved in cell wall biosynthesis
VVSTVKNEAGSLAALLDSLSAQSRQPDEIVVVDGGSSDGTWELLCERAASWPGLRPLREPGANIAAGRNLAIAQAEAEVVAVTDAGVRLADDWLERLTAPFEQGSSLERSPASSPDVVSGFFHPDPHGLWELALGATTLPTESEIDPTTFLPSSRSVAFRKQAWKAVGGYPEWLDYCEDLVFDIALREAGYRFHWEPGASAAFRPRPSPRRFWLQYYRYARGDGKARLWTARHIVRYGTYLSLLALISLGRRWPLGWALILAGGLAYCWRPWQRLGPSLDRCEASDRLILLALVPVIRLIGDLAKMAGYPVGLVWRWRHRSVLPDHTPRRYPRG